MKNFKKKFVQNTLVGNIVGAIYHWVNTRLVPEKTYIKRRYKKKFGERLNLKDPTTLNEKILWLKLNDRTPLHTQCADKFAVRDYIKKKIGDKYLVPLYYDTYEATNIIPENLPEPPYIIKTNHDSGGGIFVYNESLINWKSKWDFETTIKYTALWYKEFHDNKSAFDCCMKDINKFEAD